MSIYCKKYFKYFVRTAPQIVEIVQMVQIIRYYRSIDFKTTHLTDLIEINASDQYDLRKHLHIPSRLQKEIKLIFKRFSLYQFGKYCNDNSRKRIINKYRLIKYGKSKKKKTNFARNTFDKKNKNLSLYKKIKMKKIQKQNRLKKKLHLLDKPIK